MVQRYSIVLWKDAINGQKQAELTDCAYRMVTILFHYPEQLWPNFCTAGNLRSARPFPADRNSFEAYFAARKVKTPDGFPDGCMGYRISAFSSKNEKDSASISLTIGQAQGNVPDSFVLKLPVSFDCRNETNAKTVCALLNDLVKAFQPYYGCVYNNLTWARYANKKSEISAVAHWINYWDFSSRRAVSESKVRQVLENLPQAKWQENCLILKKTALDEDCTDDRELQQRAQKMLFGDGFGG